MKRLKAILAGECVRIGLRCLASLFFIFAGINHFLKPDFFEQIVPPGLPSPKILVSVSGLGEIAGGLGLLIHPVRRLAGWGLIALLIAVFPANIYMLVHPERFAISQWFLWARLPLQVIFVAWVWWVAFGCSQGKRMPTGTSQ